MSPGRKPCDTTKDEFHSPNKTKLCSFVCSFRPIADAALYQKPLAVNLTPNQHLYKLRLPQRFQTHRRTCGHESDTLGAEIERMTPYKQQDNVTPTTRRKNTTTAIFWETHSDINFPRFELAGRQQQLFASFFSLSCDTRGLTTK